MVARWLVWFLLKVVRLRVLVRRRAEEAKLLEDGFYTGVKSTQTPQERWEKHWKRPVLKFLDHAREFIEESDTPHFFVLGLVECGKGVAHTQVRSNCLTHEDVETLLEIMKQRNREEFAESLSDSKSPWVRPKPNRRRNSVVKSS